MIIGITGGSGTGKTTALRAFAKMGAVVIDCDDLYHELLRTSDNMLAEIRERFPEAFFEGTFERKKLGNIVFADSQALNDLNRITHEYVAIEIRNAVSALDKGSVLVIDAVALIESGLSDICDVVIGVLAPRQERLKRIIDREGISEEYAISRIDSQKHDEFFTQNCDYILSNDGTDFLNFIEKCKKLYINIVRRNDMDSNLFFTQKNVYDTISDEDKQQLDGYAERYMEYLDRAKTERLAVKYSVELAREKGFVPYESGMTLEPGKKVYYNNRGKSLMLAVIGQKSLADGVNIAAAHIDSPRLDLKQLPLFEDDGAAYLKTHYYGGIRKYQWVTIPLALYGVVVLQNGDKVEVAIGDREEDPLFVITDLLPHLSADQNKKKLSEAFAGESLNVLFGSEPIEGDEKDRVKLHVLKILNEKYGIIEEDFLSAEFEIVPAFMARELGLDKSLIGGYGQDDRSCAFAVLDAILTLEAPERTAVCVLADKEEIGSEGVSGMKSTVFEQFMLDLCDSQGVKLTHCYANSFCLSTDVCNAHDPNYPDVSEKRNSAKINFGMGIMKYTGSRGKSGSSDASAEIVGKLRQIFRRSEVAWQMAELGKVDQGGGGTVAVYMALRNIDTIDAGVPVLSMHSPYEVTSKADCYMTNKAIKAVYKNY